MALGAVRRLRDAVDVGQVIELVGRAFEHDAIDRLRIKGNDEKHLARDLEHEAFAPLFHDGGMRERQSVGFEFVKAYGGGQRGASTSFSINNLGPTRPSSRTDSVWLIAGTRRKRLVVLNGSERGNQF